MVSAEQNVYTDDSWSMCINALTLFYLLIAALIMFSCTDNVYQTAINPEIQ